jgi:hypothetical protein
VLPIVAKAYSICGAEMNNKIMLTLTVALAATLTLSFLPNIYASGARSDWSEKYDNVPGAPQYWQDGYDDGLESPFSQNRHDECTFEAGEPYLEAWMYGCIDGGNTRADCETSVDS